MSREEIEYLANEICVLKRELRTLENSVCSINPTPIPCGDRPLGYADNRLEKCLREHIENEIKEVEEREAEEECRFGSRSPMKAYWAGMKVGYTNIRCWLDHRRG